MRIKEVPTQKYLQSVLDYNPESGIFTWKIRRQKAFNKSGRVAGTKGRKARYIYVNGSSYLAHRLAYVYSFGDVLSTEMQVDHKNTNSFDNRIDNLRIATHAQNCSNANRWKKKSLPKGVSIQTKKNGYRARIQVNKKVIHIGTFPTSEAAHNAYCEAAKKYHGDFARVG